MEFTTLIILILGGLNLIIALVNNNTPQAILGAMLWYHAIKLDECTKPSYKTGFSQKKKGDVSD